MKDEACICFLQWALPHLHMRWPGFRKVRGQVCKRLGSRLVELNLSDLKSYRMYLENNPLEWHILDSMCRITISRFYRDKGVYSFLRTQVFPALIENAGQNGNKNLSCWCIGAASGEEPYSLSVLWELSGLKKRGMSLKIVGTEVDQHMIGRARKGCYPASSITHLPARIKKIAFINRGSQFCLKEEYMKRVQFVQQDIRIEQPDSSFDLILCRNLVFTYFSRELQEEIARKILTRLEPCGVLVTGVHETLPKSLQGLVPWFPGQKIYRRKI
ncbi:MAG: CheR family methyltransferase [Desulfobulbales bacterium]